MLRSCIRYHWIEGIFIEGIYGGPLDTTSKATLDTPAANIQRYISVFPGKTNLVERTYLIESGEGLKVVAGG